MLVLPIKKTELLEFDSVANNEHGVIIVVSVANQIHGVIRVNSVANYWHGIIRVSISTSFVDLAGIQEILNGVTVIQSTFVYYVYQV